MFNWLKQKLLPQNTESQAESKQEVLDSSSLNESRDMTEKKIILFDLDGTLLDSIEGIYESFCRACEDEYSPTLQEVEELVGLPLLDMFIQIGFTPQEAQNRVVRYKNHYRRICLEKTQLLPQAMEAVILASSFAHLGVVTTKTGLYSKQILEGFKILKYFQVVIGSEDVKLTKPDAEPILKALDSLPLTPKENIYMIGDTIYDIKSAKNAKIKSIWVRNGFGKYLEGEADFSFDNVYEAIKGIQGF